MISLQDAKIDVLAGSIRKTETLDWDLDRCNPARINSENKTNELLNFRLSYQNSGFNESSRLQKHYFGRLQHIATESFMLRSKQEEAIYSIFVEFLLIWNLILLIYLHLLLQVIRKVLINDFPNYFIFLQENGQLFKW